MTTMTVEAPSKLPLWRTIGQAYAVWAANFPDLVRIVWLWMVLMAPVLAILNWWQVPYLTGLMRASSSGRPFTDPNPMLTLVVQIASVVIMLPVLSSVAVAWHRLLLRDEHPGPGAYVRLDSVVVGYAVLAFWIGVIALAPSYISMLFQTVTGTSVTAPDALALIVQTLAGLISIVAFFIVGRLSLALPGKALGRADISLGMAWRVSKHNTWRMVWAYFFCILPWSVIAGGLSYWLLRTDYSQAAITLVMVVLGLLGIVVNMISVGMLSLAYRHFFERSE
jgi:hypothetical protein